MEWRRTEGIKGGEEEKRQEEEDMRKQDAEEGERIKRERERDILIEGAIKGLARNVNNWGNYKESTRMSPAKTLSNSGENTWTGLSL